MRNKYRKKDTVEALQLTIETTYDDIRKFVGKLKIRDEWTTKEIKVLDLIDSTVNEDRKCKKLIISICITYTVINIDYRFNSTEQKMLEPIFVYIGDWLIKKGICDFYTMSNESFEKEFELIEDKK